MTTEKVQYEIEVLSKGREELTKLREEMVKLRQETSKAKTITGPTGGSGAAVAPVNRTKSDLLESLTKSRAEQTEAMTKGTTGTTTATKENTKATAKQELVAETLQNRLKKIASPLREVGGLFSLLTPHTLAASLGMTAVVGVMASLNNFADKQITSFTGLAGIMNQYTTEQMSALDVSKLLAEQSALLNVPISDLQTAYSTILPIVRDMGVAEGIVADAVEIHRATGIKLEDVVKKLTSAYSEGTPVMDEHGGKLLLAAEAVDAVKEAMIEGGNEAVKYKTRVDDSFGTWLDDLKRGAGYIAAGAITAGKLAIMSEMKPDQFHQLMNDLLDPLLGPTRDRFMGWLKDVFIGTPVAVWESMVTDWDALVDSPFGQKVQELFNWEAIKGYLRVAFVETPQNIWDFITEKWDDVLNMPYIEKIEELFDWEWIKDILHTAFVQFPQSVWDDLHPGVKEVLGWFETAWGFIYDKILDPVKEAVSAALDELAKITGIEPKWEGPDRVSGTAPGLSTAIGEHGQFTPSIAPEAITGIPAMAEGGIVKRPTVVLAGEVPEAIVPLSRGREGYGQGPKEIIINIDGRRFERFVLDSLDRKVRLRGSR